MAKTILNNFLKIVIIIIVYLLQIYVINNSLLFGINGNLCLVLVILFTLLSGVTEAYIYSFLCGILSDVLFLNTFGKYTLIYIIVTSVLIGFKKIYKQESKYAIIIFIVSGIAISEVLMYVFYLFSSGTAINIFSLILLILKESIINVCLAFILYVICKNVFRYKRGN